MKMIQRFVIPWVGDERVADHFALLVKGGVRLDYVPLPPHVKGSIEFDDLKPETESKASRLDGGVSTKKWQVRFAPLLMLAASLVLFGTASFTHFSPFMAYAGDTPQSSH